MFPLFASRSQYPDPPGAPRGRVCTRVCLTCLPIAMSPFTHTQISQSVLRDMTLIRTPAPRPQPLVRGVVLYVLNARCTRSVAMWPVGSSGAPSCGTRAVHRGHLWPWGSAGEVHSRDHNHPCSWDWSGGFTLPNVLIQLLPGCKTPKSPRGSLIRRPWRLVPILICGYQGAPHNPPAPKGGTTGGGGGAYVTG